MFSPLGLSARIQRSPEIIGHKLEDLMKEFSPSHGSQTFKGTIGEVKTPKQQTKRRKKKLRPRIARPYFGKVAVKTPKASLKPLNSC